MFSDCPFVRSSDLSFVRYHNTCKRDILKANKPISMQIGVSGPRGKDIQW